MCNIPLLLSLFSNHLPAFSPLSENLYPSLSPPSLSTYPSLSLSIYPPFPPFSQPFCPPTLLYLCPPAPLPSANLLFSSSVICQPIPISFAHHSFPTNLCLPFSVNLPNYISSFSHSPYLSTYLHLFCPPHLFSVSLSNLCCSLHLSSPQSLALYLSPLLHYLPLHARHSIYPLQA